MWRNDQHLVDRISLEALITNITADIFGLRLKQILVPTRTPNPDFLFLGLHTFLRY